jgi:diacylglycerol kinase (ATP)
MCTRKFLKRLQFACEGLVYTFRSESSFRWQILLGSGAIFLLIFFKASAIWWAVILLTIGGVLATELINTALEHLCDLVHEEIHPAIKIIKDCMAGAVLVFSIAAVGILIAFLSQTIN